MNKELVNAVADVAGTYDISDTIGYISGGIQKIINGRKIIEYQKELKAKSLDVQKEYAFEYLEHEDRKNSMKSGNYRATLEYLLEMSKTGNISESDKLMTWSALDNVNNSLK